MNHLFHMKVLRAIGFGIVLVILAVMMPPVLAELTKTLIVILQSTAQAFVAAGQLAGAATRYIQ